MSIEEIEELRSWYNERVEVDHAGPEDHLFALPEEKLQQIPKSLLEKVNAFLRRISVSSGEFSQEGIHEHTLRHAFAGWLFISLMLSELKKPPIPFPYLSKTSAWISQGPSIKESLFRRTHATQKHPYMVAYLSGHADFGTTAHSYVHLFPWLVAAFLDCSEEMTPDEKLVWLASQTPSGTLRGWMNWGGIHFIPLQLLKKNPLIQIDTVEIKTGGPALPPPSFLISDDTLWLETTWRGLFKQSTKSSQPEPDQATKAIFSRSEYISNLTSSTGKSRHSMEPWSPEGCNTLRIPCPARPRHARNLTLTKLCAAILEMHRKDPQLVRDAAEIYVHHLEENEFIRFASIDESKNANRYVQFLRSMGLGKRQIEFVSGADKANPGFKSKWKSKLAEPNLAIKFGGKSKNLGPQSSLSVRPFTGARGGTGIGNAGFRFVMLMTFIVFGP